MFKKHQNSWLCSRSRWGSLNHSQSSPLAGGEGIAAPTQKPHPCSQSPNLLLNQAPSEPCYATGHNPTATALQVTLYLVITTQCAK